MTKSLKAHKCRFDKIIYNLITMSSYALRSLFQTKFSLMKDFYLIIIVNYCFEKYGQLIKKRSQILIAYETESNLISDECCMLCGLVFG